MSGLGSILCCPGREQGRKKKKVTDKLPGLEGGRLRKVARPLDWSPSVCAQMNCPG